MKKNLNLLFKKLVGTFQFDGDIVTWWIIENEMRDLGVNSSQAAWF